MEILKYMVTQDGVLVIFEEWSMSDVTELRSLLNIKKYLITALLILEFNVIYVIG